MSPLELGGNSVLAVSCLFGRLWSLIFYSTFRKSCPFDTITVMFSDFCGILVLQELHWNWSCINSIGRAGPTWLPQVADVEGVVSGLVSHAAYPAPRKLACCLQVQ